MMYGVFEIFIIRNIEEIYFQTINANNFFFQLIVFEKYR